MGAYLSEPKTSKESIDSDGNFVSCGASSMQGWRISQEDAHNCILDFDKNSSLFAVYDGHGGHEVAEYCSKYLPDYIKQSENYMKGNYEQALKDAFLGFDATLATPEVVEILKSIAGCKDEHKHGSDPESCSEEEEAIDNLVQEAHMPLDEVMAKYKGAGPLNRVLKAEGSSKPPVSPMLRGRRGCSSMSGGSGDGPSSSSSGQSSCSSSSHSTSSSAENCVMSKEDGEVSSSSSGSRKNTSGLCNGDVHVNGEVEEKEESEGEKIKTEAEVEVGSSDVKKEIKDLKLESDTSEKCEKKIERTEPDSSGVGSGDSHNVSSSSENGAIVESSDGISSSSPPNLKKKRMSPLDIYRKLLQENSDSEEEDETFTADAESEEDSDEGGDEAEGKEEDDDSSVDEEEDDEEDEDEDESYPGMEVKEEPGSDSGCTAVVALLVGNELLVANAGDSRCVVCREGKAVEMSFDHKPEDEPEKLRIETAGGKVTCDGRVNGGLNLSRAIGDHSYKQVKLLTPSQQMITALPDIQRLTVDPVKDEFMVLACDGIWNSMTSQEVVDFVRIKLEQQTERLSQICEELFDHCLAPNTQGDGTGCDNMTCVIVKFKPTLTSSQDSATKKEDTQKVETKKEDTPREETKKEDTLKRPAEEESESPCTKKSKVEEKTPVS